MNEKNIRALEKLYTEFSCDECGCTEYEDTPSEMLRECSNCRTQWDIKALARAVE